MGCIFILFFIILVLSKYLISILNLGLFDLIGTVLCKIKESKKIHWSVLHSTTYLFSSFKLLSISCNDFFDFCGEQGAKEAGRLRLEGRDYVVQDGDIMKFRFNV